MRYALYFHPKAQQEFNRLDPTLRKRFKQKLSERLQEPRVPGDQVKHASDRYKIKIQRPAFRLVYDLLPWESQSRTGYAWVGKLSHAGEPLVSGALPVLGLPAVGSRQGEFTAQEGQRFCSPRLFG